MDVQRLQELNDRLIFELARATGQSEAVIRLGHGLSVR
jgi:hypothetical protein